MQILKEIYFFVEYFFESFLSLMGSKQNETYHYHDHKFAIK